jgi:Ca2+-binding EF-hand superfamily protein
MAISAMADMMRLSKEQLMDLRGACLRHTKPSRSGHDKSPTITKENFRKALNELNMDVNDIDVLEHLFTMWDKHGENKVSLLIFLSGISPLASDTDVDVERKLLFAFEIFDVENSGRMKKSNALKILNGINSTASYFGDAVVSTQAVDIIVTDIYKEQTEIFYEEYMDLFSSHPAVIQFSTSGGKMKYGA